MLVQESTDALLTSCLLYSMIYYELKQTRLPCLGCTQMLFVLFFYFLISSGTLYVKSSFGSQNPGREKYDDSSKNYNSMILRSSIWIRFLEHVWIRVTVFFFFEIWFASVVAQLLFR